MLQRALKITDSLTFASWIITWWTLLSVVQIRTTGSVWRGAVTDGDRWWLVTEMSFPRSVSAACRTPDCCHVTTPNGDGTYRSDPRKLRSGIERYRKNERIERFKRFEDWENMGTWTEMTIFSIILWRYHEYLTEFLQMRSIQVEVEQNWQCFASDLLRYARFVLHRGQDRDLLPDGLHHFSQWPETQLQLSASFSFQLQSLSWVTVTVWGLWGQWSLPVWKTGDSQSSTARGFRTEGMWTFGVAKGPLFLPGIGITIGSMACGILRVFERSKMIQSALMCVLAISTCL